ncbi:MAG TPA: hypothetical protein VK508_19885 [Cyclobacteriaceae bacterium]|nr:hypothetical protein [Cyclobacteriaceae bacterium]
MKTYRLALIFLATVTVSGVSAQTFADLETGRGKNAFLDWSWELMVRRTQVNTKYTIDYGGTTFTMKFRADDYEKGGMRWHFENPTLGDLIWVLARTVRGKEMPNQNSNGAEQAFGSGFIGWHNVTWNAVAQDRLLISPGMSFGDYIFASQRAGGITMDPAGYYFHVGPSLMVTPMVTDNIWIDIYARYDITGKAGGMTNTASPTEGKYKNPNFFGLGASLKHKSSHLCFTTNYTKMIDRGANKDSASRVDISLGFMF